MSSPEDNKYNKVIKGIHADLPNPHRTTEGIEKKINQNCDN